MYSEIVILLCTVLAWPAKAQYTRCANYYPGDVFVCSNIENGGLGYHMPCWREGVCRECMNGAVCLGGAAARCPYEIGGQCYMSDSTGPFYEHYTIHEPRAFYYQYWQCSSGCLDVQPCAVCSANTYLTNCDGPHAGDCIPCSNCGPGKYYVDGCSTYALGGWPYDTICAVCPIGKYSDQVHNTVCKQCPASKTTLTIGSTASTNCVSCPKGYSFDSQNLCVSCLPGTYSSNGLACQACPGGAYAPNFTATACLYCDRGKYGVLTGQVDNSSCVYDCPLGTTGQIGRCFTCSEGNYASSLGSTTCTYCIRGKYQTIRGATSSYCIQCPDGTYNLDSGTPSACRRCTEGKFNFNLQIVNATFCYSCAPGSYTTALASSTCILCAAGKYSSMTERSSAAACLGCAGGTYSSPGAGVCCASGTYSMRASTICCPFNSFVLPNTTTCQACPAGSYIASSTSCLSCPVGFYSSSAASASCRSCAYCSSGSYAYACGGSSAGVCTQCTN